MGIEATGRDVLRVGVGRLIDGVGDGVLEGSAAILVEDGRIVAVGPDARVPRPAHARIVDHPGATALPGLIDSHIHLTLPPTEDPVGSLAEETDTQLIARGVAAAERMVRCGVTTAADLGGRGGVVFEVREAIRRGIAFGPRILAAGRPVTPIGGHCRFWLGEVDGEADVRGLVRRLIVDEGADLIKIMATGGGLTEGTNPREACYPTEVLAAAADEAHGLGKRITAHAHGIPGIRRATEAGIDSIQHCSMVGPNWEWRFDESVARLMAERGTRAVTTVSPGSRFEMESGGDIGSLQPNGGAMTRGDWHANALRLHQCGVTIVPGTDVGVNLTDYGEEIFLELEAYVHSVGFTPLETIHRATRLAAWHLGIEDETGRLAPGLAGDILVVDGAPDRDFAAIRRPLLVVRGGTPIRPIVPPPLPTGPAMDAWQAEVRSKVEPARALA